MDHEDQDSIKAPWRIKFIKRKKPFKRQLDWEQARNRYIFLRYSADSLNGVPLVPEVFNESRLLSEEDFTNYIVATFKKLHPKSEEKKLERALHGCSVLYDNLVDGGFDTCSDSLLYAISIQQSHAPFVMCARRTYDRSYYYLIPILRHILLNATKRPSQNQSSTDPDSIWGMFHYFKSRREPAKPEVLILCPSEMTGFLLNRTRRLCDKTNLLVAAIRKKDDPIPRNTSILIADPMVLNCENKNLTLNNLRFCVLDDCDIFFRGVYSETLNKLMSRINKKCQLSIILGFLSKKAIRFIDKHLKDYNALFCGSFPSITMNIRLKVIECEDTQKTRLAVECIRKHCGTPILLYLNDPSVKTDLVRELNLESKIVNERTQLNRTAKILLLKESMGAEEKAKVIDEFRSLSDPVLIVSDEAADELEFEDVPILINYDLPPSMDAFEFRHSCIGRNPTLPPFYSFPDKSDKVLKSVKSELIRDWVNKEGFNKPSAISYSFYNSSNYYLANDLVRLLTECQEHVPPFLKTAGMVHEGKTSNRSLSRANSITSGAQTQHRLTEGNFSSRTSILETSLPSSSEYNLNLPYIQEEGEMLSTSLIEQLQEPKSYITEPPAEIDYDSL